MTPQTGTARLARTLALTAAAQSLAVAAHALGGGGLPPLVTIVSTGALLLLLVAACTGRELRLPALLTLLGGSQLLLHTVFHLSAAPVPVALGAASPGLHGGGHGSHALAAGDAVTAAGSGHGHLAGPGAWLGASLGLTPAMLVGHALAVLATAWVLRRGEAVLWRLAAWVRPRPLRTPELRLITPPRYAACPGQLPAAQWRGTSRSSRGPPVLVG